MISLDQRMKALIRLGDWLKGYYEHVSGSIKEEHGKLSEAVKKAQIYNPWFIESFVNAAIGLWAARLSEEAILKLCDRYADFTWAQDSGNISVIPQEDIPLDGFHDFICVILSGKRFYCRNSHHNFDVLQLITMKILEFEPTLRDHICWCDYFPKKMDAYLIHARYLHDKVIYQYFENKNSLIRNKRLSVGVLIATDQTEDFQKFAEDIVTFFGLSPWNIRKLFVPEGFTINDFYPALMSHAYIYQYNRYANNYDYQRSVFLMERIPFFENGFMIMRESADLQVPIGCIHFEYYQSIDDLRSKLKRDEFEIQQVITNADFISTGVKPGNAFQYSLIDFEDHKDTLSFLTTLVK